MAFAKMIDPTLLCEITAERVLWFNKSLNVMNWVLAEEATAPLVKSIPGTTTIRKSLLPAAAAATTSSSGSSDENDKAMLQPCNQPQLEHQIGRWRWGGHLPELDEGSNDRLFPDGKARDDSQRKRYFRQKANGDQFVFKPENVYHFELYNPTTDVNTWKCDMGPLVSLDLRKYMLSNPLPFTLKSESEGTIFFSVEFDWIKTPKSE